ncbi:hypothetical protein [uncultured Mediterranean phage uvMED]|nr:hypothetical protein [uncultured Mediterranean phage uvMED]
MSFSEKKYYEIECNNNDCGFIEIAYSSNNKEAVKELKDEGWIFDGNRISNGVKNTTYCSNDCKKEATS